MNAKTSNKPAKVKPSKIVRELNGIIASRNLYVASEGGNRRVIDAHLFNNVPYLTDLHTGNAIKVEGAKLQDGYGREVTI